MCLMARAKNSKGNILLSAHIKLQAAVRSAAIYRKGRVIIAQNIKLCGGSRL